MIEEHGSLAEKFLKKGFWLYLFSFIIAPIGYIIKIIVSGELSVSEVGILYWIISLIILVSSYNDLWMSESLKYFIPKFLAENNYSKVKSLLFIAFFVQIFTAIIMSLIFLFWSDFLSKNYFKTEAAADALKIFATFFLWYNLIQTISNFFISIQNTLLARVSDFIRMFWTLGLVLFLFFSDSSSLIHFSLAQVIWVYLWAFVAISTFYFLYYRKYLRDVAISFKYLELKKIFSYAFLVVVGASAGTILSQIDMQMIIYILGTTDAWYYTNYLSIIGIPFMILWPIFGLLFPVIAELHGKADHEKIKNIKKIFWEIFITVWIMFNIFFFIFAEVIAFVLFWENFVASGSILQYSILFLIFNFLVQINYNLQAGIWNIKINVRITFAAMLINIITNIIFINILWVYWAALATGLWWVFMYVTSQIFIDKKYKSSFQIGYIIKNITAFAIVWFAYWKLMDYIQLFELRMQSFFFLWLLFAVWFWFFILMNNKMCRGFIKEIKKIKWKKA